ncbi:ABC transporter ATP-binding protein [Pseudonocardia sp. CA-107938]|uniref:ABC transporter ATP-binding protein n=1 Tax=Pseudonocardia sp. CA-107938 TaxID=3240021 RepID=UPI003D89E9F2
MAAPLIGVDDLRTPKWAEGYVNTASASPLAVAAAAPRTARYVAGWAWRAAPGLTVAVAVLQLAAGVVTAFGLLATADVFTRLLQAGPTPERVVAALPAVAVVVAALAGRGLLDAAIGAVQGSLVPRIEQQAHDEVHAAVIGVELAAFDDADFAELVDRASVQGPNRLRSAAEDTSDLISQVVSATAAVVTAGLLHPLLAPAVLLATIPQGWASVRSARMMFDSVLRNNSRWRRRNITGALIMQRDPAAEVRAFTAQSILIAEHRRINDAVAAEEVRLERAQTVVRLVGRALGGIGAGLAFALLAVLLYLEVLPLALAGTAVVAMRTATQATGRMIFQANHLFESSFFIGMLRDCLVDAAARRRPAEAIPTDLGPETIALTDVTFHYHGKDEPAVDGISVTLRRGETIALVGENGSGKSTLAKLVTGLYLPTTGSVSWDGHDTRTIAEPVLHERVAVVLQDPLRWPMTAENNVRIGRIDDPDDGTRLAAAAERSGADTVVADLPAGWTTVLSREFQDGHDLSGGQWQRIAVARGLYRDAPVVVADEPTAALDARAEHAVFTSLRGLAAASSTTAGRITILVTHRLANVRTADQILVLDHGKLVEQGRHAELMARGGLYAELFDLQARAYGDG